MKFIHKKASEYSVSHWTGGKTTELFIFPEQSQFVNRDFDFRISTASIEAETSSFTLMKGYLRKLLVLEGSLLLHHEGQHSNSLSAFEQDEFSGDWNTTSNGKAVDFNVIYKPNLNPEIRVVFLKEGDEFCLENGFIFILEGELSRAGLIFETNSSLFTSDLLNFKARKQSTIILVNF